MRACARKRVLVPVFTCAVFMDTDKATFLERLSRKDVQAFVAAVAIIIAATTTTTTRDYTHDARSSALFSQISRVSNLISRLESWGIAAPRFARRERSRVLRGLSFSLLLSPPTPRLLLSRLTIFFFFSLPLSFSHGGNLRQNGRKTARQGDIAMARLSDAGRGA